MYIPLQPDRGGVNNLRRTSGSSAAEFPAWMLREDRAAPSASRSPERQRLRAAKQ